MKRILTHLAIVIAATLGLATLGTSDAAARGNKHHVRSGHGHGHHGHVNRHNRHRNHRWNHYNHHNNHRGYDWRYDEYDNHYGHSTHHAGHLIDLGWLFGGHH